MGAFMDTDNKAKILANITIPGLRKCTWTTLRAGVGFHMLSGGDSPPGTLLSRYPDPLYAHSSLVYSVQLHGAQRRGSPAVPVQQLHSTETNSKFSRLKDSAALISKPSRNSFFPLF